MNAIVINSTTIKIGETKTVLTACTQANRNKPARELKVKNLGQGQIIIIDGRTSIQRPLTKFKSESQLWIMGNTTNFDNPNNLTFCNSK